MTPSEVWSRLTPGRKALARDLAEAASGCADLDDAAMAVAFTLWGGKRETQGGFVYVIQLNDAPVAVTDKLNQASKMREAVEEKGTNRQVFVRAFNLNEWPTEWAGEEPS